MSNQDIEKGTLMLGGKGVESFVTRLKLKRRHLGVSFAVGAVAAAATVCAFLASVSPMTQTLIKNQLWQAGEGESVEWTVQCRLDDWGTKGFRCGSRSRPSEYVLTTVSLPGGKTKLTNAEYDGFISDTFIPAGYAWWQPSPTLLSKFMVLMSVLMWLGGSVFAFRLFYLVGKEETTNRRIDGAHNLVSGKALSKLVSESAAGSCGWTLAGVMLPAFTMLGGIVICGAQRTGKSLVIHDLINQAKSKNVRLFVNDPAGEFWKAHGRPEDGDVFVNPTLLGGVVWSIFKEMIYTYDADYLAEAMLPRSDAKGGGSEFFENGARNAFGVFLTSLAEKGAINTNELPKAFYESTEEEMAEIVKNTSAARSLSGDAKGMRDGVLASVEIHLSGLAAMADGSWTISDFLKQPKGNLYFIGDEAKFRALYRLMIVTACEVIKKMGVESGEVKYLFILDEAAKLGDIRADRQLAENAKWGLSMVLALQTEVQMVIETSEERADALFGVVGTTLQLRTSEPKAMERASKKFLSQSVRMVAQSQTLAVAEQKDSLGLNKTEQDRPLIIPSNFGMLKKLTGYLQVIEGFPAAKIDYRHWLKEGTGANGGSYVSELKPTKNELPAKDTRFLLKVNDGGNWRTANQIGAINTQIDRLRKEVETMSREPDKIKKIEKIGRLEAKRTMLEGGEVPASDQKFGIEAEDLDLDIDMETGEIMMPDDDGMLI